MAGRPPLRLYRDDSHLTRFGARVTAAAPAGEGLLSLELDRTAFYPTGGGQPHDTGRLADLEVVDVREAQDGRILHLVKAGPASPSPGDDVEAEIDWLRRFDHMQQHTGQHILSRAFLDAAAASTRSFHLGESACTIDLDLPAATERTIRQAESIANQVIFDDRPVAVRLLDPAQAPRPAAGAGPEREPVLRPGDAIRLIGVKDFDETPCGGTHVRSSGAVGSVAIRGWERFKGGTRVTFLCGGRVVAAFRSLASAADACAARLSAHPYELDAAAARLLEHLAEARRGLRTLSERLAQTEAAELRREAREAAGLRVVVRDLGERPAEELQRLAQACAAAPGTAALLAAVEPGSAAASLVFARSSEGGTAAAGLGEIMAAVCRARGGKGGGGGTFARGGGIPAAAAAEALEEAFGRLRSGAASGAPGAHDPP